MDDRELLKQIDACRPGSADLTSSELAELAQQVEQDASVRSAYEKVQQFDARIAAKIADVALPPGLAERLLLRLAAENAPSPSRQDELGTADSDSVAIAKRFAKRPRASRQRAWPVWAAAAAAVLAFVAIWWTRLPGEFDTIETVLRRANDFYTAENRSTAKQLLTDPPPKDFPISRAVAYGRDTRWRPVADFLGRRGLAYDLVSSAGTRATLYVVPRGDRPGRPKLDVRFPATPPTSPKLTTGGRAMAAWQEKGLLYVMVVDGDARQYSQFFQTGGPLAFAPAPEKSGWLVSLSACTAALAAES